MKKLKVLFRGLAGLFSALLAIIVAAFIPMYNNAGIVNQALGLSTSMIVNDESAEETDTDYYKNRYGNDVYSKQAALEVEMAAVAENITQAEEGTVLLKNEDNALPLAAGTQMTLFGNGAYHAHYAKNKETSSFASLPVSTVLSGLQKVFGQNNVNSLESVYAALSRTTDTTVYEADISAVTAQASSWANGYNDAAVVVLTRWGAESRDSAYYDSESGERYLSLQPNERDLLEYLQEQKQAGVFKKIIVLINADQMMELGFLDEYEIDGCLLMGITGTHGFEGVANVLAGKVSASGHLVDTYAENSLSAPAVVYANENVMRWGNVDEVNATVADAADNNGQYVDYYTVYAEGIYVGYKYYETRYADSVMGSGKATSTVGSSTGSAWNYADEMVYTFGYGLSYTTFTQTLDEVKYNDSTDKYEVTVTVQNTGSVAGKSVVQVYAQTPYGEYEKQHSIEKSAITLVGFEKTDTLEPNASQTVTVEVERYLLASYDSEGEKGYILSEGDYYLAIGEDAHDALNNVLAAQGYTNLTDAKGNAVSGDSAKTYHWTQSELDADSYRYSKYAEESTVVTNQFDFADVNYYLSENDQFTYLSRNDWDATFPTTAVTINATEQMMEDMDCDWYETPADAPSVDSFTQGTEKTIMFVTMKDVAWDDTEMWDLFLNQFTVDELVTFLQDNTGSEPIESVALPAAIRSDDNMQISATMLANGESCISWVSEVMTARTWNKERFTERGYMMGVEATFCGVYYVNYGGGNIHRSPFGGRNMQYYSEDANYGYYMGIYEAQGMQSVGVVYAPKHFAMNECETYRESLASFATEQTIRESCLRSFEGAFCEGGALGTMSGFNRIGVQYNVTCVSLFRNVLKGEWGFRGQVTGDAWSDRGFQNHYLEELVAGLDFDTWNYKKIGDAVKEAINGGDGYILQLLRDSAKQSVYTEAHSIVINGLTSNSVVVKITPWWQIAMVSGIIASFALMLAGIVAYVVTAVAEHRKQEEK